MAMMATTTSTDTTAVRVVLMPPATEWLTGRELFMVVGAVGTSLVAVAGVVAGVGVV